MGTDPVVIENYREFIAKWKERILANVPKNGAPDEWHEAYEEQQQLVRALERAVNAWDGQSFLLDKAELEIRRLKGE
jgi:hypothetical protein